MKSMTLRVSRTAGLVFAGAALLAWAEGTAALPEHYVEIVLTVDGMV